ncbi:DNA-3-methyladenine glycosylase 2 family protein [Rhodanobacter denitrificans]|uniref:DNA-3-methyladenine glycosylase II n=1 Tax=Rhodanobacter denitrificans TaxID=666685 RepID=A0A368KJ49_9GAMM|nr:DNA-3-methyladenine glycosylase [Rhodanobacter denitrificans]RCS30713.1 DNA-3-methyladenine glycosylase 2 family protein [Rhodanobacter denitrificans]
MPTDAAAFLAAIDADWARLVAQVGPCGHEPKPTREPYEALVRAVAYQQLHVKAGDAILARLLALYPQQAFPLPAQLLDAGIDAMRGCGFSARKTETIRGIAAAAQDGVVPDLGTALALSDEELVARLGALKGIGRWTVEMFLIYSLGRPDILPVDDFGVREGYRLLKSLDTAPAPKALAAIGARWSPHRTAAAWYLWRVPRPPKTARRTAG